MIKIKKKIILVFIGIICLGIYSLNTLKKSYIINPKEQIEVGHEIPEGTYIVKLLNKSASNDESSTRAYIGGENIPNANFYSLDQLDNQKIELIKGTMISTNAKIKLVKH